MPKKFCFALIGVLMLVHSAQAQYIQEIVSKSIDDAIPVFDKMLKDKDFTKVKLLGLGDVSLFAKESKRLTTAFSAYLIRKQQFRNVVLQEDDWKIRPLNKYLTSSVPADTVALDVLIKSTFPSNFQFRNREFRSFLQWLKQYNLTHPKELVSVYGVAPDSQIPPAYFLAAYVFEIDQASGDQLSEKWSNEDTPDSLAYADIEVWLQAVKKKKVSSAVQEQMLRCEQDLMHNKYVLKPVSADQKFPQSQLNNRARYIANQVLNKLGKKTIYYAENYQVATRQLKSSLVLGDLPISSIGKYLNDDLKSAYQSMAIDFADSARTVMIDVKAGQGSLTQVTGTAEAKALYQKADYIDGKDTLLLKGYEPAMLWPFKGQALKIITGKDAYAIDALFLFSTLTEVDLTY